MSLTIRNLTKTFEEKTLFRDFSYSFAKTGIYALTGKSGSGKTTLIRIISGLDNDFKGTVSGGGFKNVSLCFQEHRLFSNLNAFDNIYKVSFKNENEENKHKVKELLKKLAFTEEDMELFPSELSGGMRQRIAFARALLKDSSILILDEVTKELDLKLKTKVLKIIKDESLKRLVIVVTHDTFDLSQLEATEIKIDGLVD